MQSKYRVSVPAAPRHNPYEEVKMFSFSDPFGIKRRKREKMEQLIAPYVRPDDDELTKEALRRKYCWMFLTAST